VGCVVGVIGVGVQGDVFTSVGPGGSRVWGGSRVRGCSWGLWIWGLAVQDFFYPVAVVEIYVYDDTFAL
jgi:hypothetical protein